MGKALQRHSAVGLLLYTPIMRRGARLLAAFLILRFIPSVMTIRLSAVDREDVESWRTRSKSSGSVEINPFCWLRCSSWSSCANASASLSSEPQTMLTDIVRIALAALHGVVAWLLLPAVFLTDLNNNWPALKLHKNVQAGTKKISNKRTLQRNLSRVLDEVYNAAPKIMNELINRDKPSAQAIAARNKLVFALFENQSEKDLCIEKTIRIKGKRSACSNQDNTGSIRSCLTADILILNNGSNSLISGY